ncbi:MAG: hypothetical protein WDW38_003929 [Sanguina aurantia]
MAARCDPDAQATQAPHANSCAPASTPPAGLRTAVSHIRPALLILLCAGLSLPASLSAACQLRLIVDPASSPMSLTGNNMLEIGGTNITSPLAQPLYWPNIARGFTGSLYASSTAQNSSCPTSAGSWGDAMPALSLSTHNSPYFYFPGVALFPPLQPQLTVGFLYNLSEVRIRLNATSMSHNPDGTLAIDWQASIQQAYLYTENFFTGTRLDSLAGGGANFSTNATLQLNSSSLSGNASSMVLRMSFPVNVTFSADSTVTSGSKTYGAHSDLTIAGNISASGEYGCPIYCGDHGRCVVLNGTLGCECQCGWTANSQGACTKPGGYCPTFGDAASSSVVTCNQNSAPPPAVASPAAPPASGSWVALSTSGTCPSGYAVNAQGLRCDICMDGFLGEGCSQCQSDLACQASLNTTRGQCVSGPVYVARSNVKKYACALTDPNLALLLGPTLNFQCHTSRPVDSASSQLAVISGGGTLILNASPVNTTPHCDVQFRLAGMALNQHVQCTGWQCVFSVNTSSVECALVRCSCPTGSCVGNNEDYGALLRPISGTMALSCGPNPTAAGNAFPCSIAISGFPIASVGASCQVSECVDSGSGPALHPQYVSVQDPVISFMGPCLLILMAAACALSLTTVMPFLKPQTTTTTNTANTANTSDATKDISGSSSCSGGSNSSGKPAGRGRLTPSPSPGPGPVAEGVLLSSVSVSQAAGGGGSVSGGAASGRLAAPDCVAISVRTSGNGLGALPTAGAVEELRKHRHDAGKPGMKDSLGREDGTGARRAKGSPGKEDGGGCVTVLHSVSGVALCGQVLGLLGPSGCGKSSLLNVLSGQISPASRRWACRGCVRLDGCTVSASQLSRVTAHVPQSPLIMAGLTVREVITYSAVLRMEEGASPAQVQSRVEAVMQELGIRHLRDRVISTGGGAPGGAGDASSVSGGERQRVSIAMELVTSPPVLMLDEPTSGLDSYTAAQLLSTLVSLARAGRVVITSLHQPSPQLFAMLDQAILLAAGRAIFSGVPDCVVARMAELGAPCPVDLPPAEHMLASVGDPETLSAILMCLDAQQASPLQPPPSHDSAKPSRCRWTPAQPPSLRQGMARGWRELGVHSWRNGLGMLRSPELALMHCVVAAVLGIVVGAVYYQSGLDKEGAQNRLGGIFFVVSILAFLSTTAVDLTAGERPVVAREVRRHFYGPTPYMASKLVADGLMLRFLPALILAIPFYWMMGLRPDAAAFVTFLGVYSTFACVVGALCLTVSCFIVSAGHTILAINLLLLTASILSGFLANRQTMTWALRWIVYVSPIHYAWEALVINELAPLSLTLQVGDLPTLPDISGDVFLSFLGVDPRSLSADVVVLALGYAGFVLAALAAMALRAQRERRL